MKLHALVLSLLSLPGCGSGVGVQTVAPGAGFRPEVQHPYFPLVPGMVRTYVGEHEGKFHREEVRTLEQTRTIMGIDCVAIVEDVYLDEELVEVTTEWYAQDERGVWKFGEESLALDDGQLVLTEDSWLAGVGDALPWLAFPADPQVGDVFLGYTPQGPDQFEILSVTATAKVPAGTFDGCVELAENPEDPDDADIILYAPGVGRVSERNAAGQLRLESVPG